MNKLLKKLFSAYLTNYPLTIAYMWQASEYRYYGFLKWWARVEDFRTVSVRGKLVHTKIGNLVYLLSVLTSFAYWVLNMLIIWYLRHHLVVISVYAIFVVLAYSLYVAIFTAIPIYFMYGLWFLPKEDRAIAKSKAIFAGHRGTIIAVAGSYGKTTMKELLLAVLSTENEVVATEGNRNTVLSISKFASKLTGKEDYVIVEFGEARKDDIARLTNMVQPDFAVITGLAPNHLDGYETIDEIANDLMVLVAHTGKENTFINIDSPDLSARLSEFGKGYSQKGCLEWSVEGVKVAIDRTEFKLKGYDEELKVSTKLIGRHNIGVVSFVVAFAREADCGAKSIEKALASQEPHEHRMHPKKLHGAWLIDDTYNGNIEGMKAGLALLKELKTKGQKRYATPGLVDQGAETVRVHVELGKAIAQAKPDYVYLMNNSVTEIIKNTLQSEKFKGKVQIVDEPLSFYQNIESVLAKGDIILCQNDWPDYYA
ncbi:hypothetical protein KC930_00165 [Candidatus Saccharibacteria bacterium]|nr:hypothetical protein [Candidatus Saccharibacteria bacterium]